MSGSKPLSDAEKLAVRIRDRFLELRVIMERDVKHTKKASPSMTQRECQSAFLLFQIARIDVATYDAIQLLAKNNKTT